MFYLFLLEVYIGVFIKDFKWQIQMRSSIDKLKEMSETEDLFKVRIIIVLFYRKNSHILTF